MKLDILLVDDDKLVNEFIGETLQRGRHNITTAFSGEEAKEYMGRSSYDIVITDIKMHKISGMDLLEYIVDKLMNKRLNKINRSHFE